MAIGHFLGLGDKTSCGGKVLDADTTMTRWGEEPGFYIVPQSMSREALMAELFDTFTPAASYRFLSLNPRWKTVKAGTLVVLSDPANLQCTREERLLIEAADIANSALESLSPEEANFMMRHREEIATFLGYGSTAVGVGQVMFAQHLNGTKKLLEQVDELHRHSFQKYGHLRSPEFFAERKRLLAQLDAHLNGFLRKGIGLGDQPKLKKALGISSRSLVHHWSQAGVVDHIPGHATQISALTRASKIISAGGWIGTAVGGGASYLKVQEVCSAGNAAACESVKFTEGGSFLGGVGLGALGASGATLALGGVCIGIGVATAAVGGVACGVVVSGGGAFAGSWVGEKTGAFIGQLIYEGVK